MFALRHAPRNLFALFVLGLLALMPRALPADDSEDLDASIEQALEKATTLTVPETSVADLAAFLRVQAGVPVVIDQRACEDVGLDIQEALVSGGPFENISLGSILNHLLRPVDLTWTIRDRALTITTPDEEEMSLVTRVYDVQDLVGTPDRLRFEFWNDYDSLVDILTSTVATYSWDEVGGPASIEPFRGTLVVSQTVHVHRQIRDCLAAFRRAKSIAERGSVTARDVSVGTHDAATRRVYGALDRRVRWRFHEQSLSEVAAEIQRQAKVPVVLDLQALEDAGLGGDMPITLAMRDRTLHDALSQMLRELDLTYSVRDEAIVITTPEEAETQLELRVYPIADLLGEERMVDEFTNITREADADGLTALITSLIAPDSWDDVGGPGSIEGHPRIDVLVISQTPQIHGKIEQMLMQIRQRIQLASPPAEAEQAAGSKKTPVPHTAENNVGDDPFGGEDPFASVSPPHTSKDADLRFVVYFIAVPQPTATGQPAGAGGQGTPGGSGQPSPTTPPPVVGQYGGGMSGFGQGMMYGLPPAVPIESGELLEIVRELVAPDSWKVHPRIYARATAGRLLIRQTLEVHDQIHSLLNRLGVLSYSTLQFTHEPPIWSGPHGFGGGMGGGFGSGMGGGGFFFVPSRGE